ncbi:SDR family NAD(P)-dependent oxidoreductase [Acrocarpospora sp. B8E8]|uniref:SDR family NAD(P)-dependent oxidoreductase n=1 Tax=Acrocarpospora sp. B8E8 TaxID=3153572 RepID=UPI00325F8D3D
MTKDLHGRTVVITGASSGIGAAAALRLAERGATVVAVGRSAGRTREIAARLGTEPQIADFARFSEVRALAGRLLDRYPRIDVLANNAGGLVSERRVTTDDHELTFQANHLAPFLLTKLLLPRLRESGARVVTTASVGNRFGKLDLDDLEWTRRRYGGGWIAYSTSKLMNILFTRELARREAGVTAVCFHPRRVAAERGVEQEIRFASGSGLVGVVSRIPLIRRVALGAADGAGPLIALASASEVANGAYHDGLRAGAKVNPQADDAQLATRLWELSEAYVSA